MPKLRCDFAAPWSGKLAAAQPQLSRRARKFSRRSPRRLGTTDTEPELSVVIPVYNEVENITVLYARLIAVLEGANINFEIVFVDDGSGDESVRRLNELGASDKRIVVIELARNFGHQVAITAGLDFARGRGIAVMDADLQDPPEVLPQFIAKWREGYDVVYAVREHRKEGWLKRTSYKAFYRLLRRVSNIEIPLDAGDFCVMDRRVVDLLKSCRSATDLSAAYAAGLALIRWVYRSSGTPATLALRSTQLAD